MRHPREGGREGLLPPRRAPGGQAGAAGGGDRRDGLHGAAPAPAHPGAGAPRRPRLRLRRHRPGGGAGGARPRGRPGGGDGGGAAGQAHRPPGPARPAQGVRDRDGGLREALHVLRGADHAGPRAQPSSGRGGGRGARSRRPGLSRGHAARPDRQRLRPGPDAADRPRRPARAPRPDRGDRAHPVHHLEPVQPHLAADPRHPRRPQGGRVPPPAAAVGLGPGARADEPRIHARPLPRADRRAAGRRARHRPVHGPHRRLSRGDRRRLRADGGHGRSPRLRQCLRLPVLAAPGHARRRHARSGAGRGEGPAQHAHSRGGGAGRRRAEPGPRGPGGVRPGRRLLAAEPAGGGGPDALQPRGQLRPAGPGPPRRGGAGAHRRGPAAQPARAARRWRGRDGAARRSA